MIDIFMIYCHESSPNQWQQKKRTECLYVKTEREKEKERKSDRNEGN